MVFTSFDDQQKAELWSCLALGNIAGLGATKRKKLVDSFATPFGAINKVNEWCSTSAGITSNMVQLFKSGTWRDAARLEWNNLKNTSANVLLYSDSAYPQLLKEIPDAPLFLLYYGNLELINNSCVAVVGARNCSKDGMSVAVQIVQGLSSAGITTVSGMAKGIDRVVHITGLSGVGSSIAVLGSGIDVVYPKSNSDLYKLLKEDGLILSEYMSTAIPIARNFPIRNRIISGLSRAVLVIEAATNSGTLITARHALEQNRDIYAVPGSSLSKYSVGCQELIRQGAKAVFSATDILRELAPILRTEVANSIKNDVIENNKLNNFPELVINIDEITICALPWGEALEQNNVKNTAQSKNNETGTNKKLNKLLFSSLNIEEKKL